MQSEHNGHNNSNNTLRVASLQPKDHRAYTHAAPPLRPEAEYILGGSPASSPHNLQGSITPSYIKGGAAPIQYSGEVAGFAFPGQGIAERAGKAELQPDGAFLDTKVVNPTHKVGSHGQQQNMVKYLCGSAHALLVYSNLCVPAAI